MKRAAIPVVVFVLLAVGLAAAGWSDSWDQGNPKIPTAGLYVPGIGRCVALYEGDELIGITVNRTEDMNKANKNRSGYAISTYNALGIIAQRAGRPDLAALAVDLRMTDGPDPSLEGGTMTCWCENTIWQRDGRSGKLIAKGCAGACGSCTHCAARYPSAD